MFTVVPDDCPGQPGAKDGSPSLIDEIVREGARRMLAEALQAEVDTYIAAFAAERGRGRPAAGGPQRLSPGPGGADQRGRGAGDRAAGE